MNQSMARRLDDQNVPTTLISGAATKASNEQAVVPMLQLNAPTAGTPDDEGKSGAVPMGMAASIMAAFLLMMEFCNEINKMQNETSSAWAKAMMGSDKDSGLMAHYYQTSVASGDAQANDTRWRAIGSLMGAGFSLGGLAVMGGGYCK